MTFSARYIIQSQGQAVLLTGVRWIGINRDRLGYLAATGDTRTPARVFTATVSIFVSSAPVPLALKGTPACVWEIRSVCIDVFVLEAWGDRGQRSHADFNSGSVCVCVWRQGENRGTRLYNGARAQPASRSFHLSAAAPRHARTHYFSWPTDLTRPAVICHLAAIWPVSAGLLSARGSMVIPPFEGRPIQSHGWHCQNGLHYCDLYSAPANLSSTSTGEKVKKGGKLAMSSTSLLVLLSAVSSIL